MAWNSKPEIVVVFDLETVEIPLTKAREDELIADWAPPKNIKDPEKIEERRQEFIKGLSEKNKFRLGGARVISAAFGEATRSGMVNVDGIAHEDPNKIAAWIVDYLSEYPAMRLCGYNINNFDIPQLILLLHKANLSLKSPQGKWDPIDLCMEVGRSDSYKMKSLAEIFGIPAMKDDRGNILDGAAVQGLYDMGEMETILEYNKHDVMMEGELYLAISRVKKL